MTSQASGARRATVKLDAPEALDAVSRARLRTTVLRAIDRAFQTAGMATWGATAVTAAELVDDVATGVDTARYTLPSFGDGGSRVGLPVRAHDVGATGGAATGASGDPAPTAPDGRAPATWAPVAGRMPARAAGRTPVRGRPSRNDALLVTPPETADRVNRFLTAVARRLPDLGNLDHGQLRGNVLTTAGGSFTVHTGTQLAEGDTVSGRLGPGVFHLRPIRRDGLGVAALTEGGSYAVERIGALGGRTPTGVRVVTRDLPPALDGLLVYAPRTMYMPEAVVSGRPPADVDALVRLVVVHMDTAGSVLNPSITAYLILATLGPQRLSPEETMALLARLGDDGRLGEFLNLVRLPRFRQYLRDQGVDWSHIYANWEPSVNDSGLFFAGFLFGAGESATDAIRLVAVLIGGRFSEELARERAALFDGVRRLVEHPVISAAEGAQQLVKAIEDALWDLDFFGAGRILGNLTVVLLTLPTAIRALPRAARSLALASVRLATLTLAAVRRLGVSLRSLAEFLRQPVVRMVTPEGLTLMKMGDDVVILDGGARLLGRLERLFTPAEVEQWARTFGEPGAGPGPRAPIVAGKLLIDLEDVVRRAIAAVRSRLGSQWLPPRQFGTVLHAAVEDLISTVKVRARFRVFAEQQLDRIIQLTADVAEMTVAEFLTARPHLKDFLHVPAELLEQKIGKLVPDLVIFEPGGAAVVWDLTSVSRAAHLAKTQLYAHVLQELGKLGLVRIGETYWATRVPAGAAAAVPAAAGGPAVGGAARTVDDVQEQDR
jgi:hypothetical protein